METAHCDVRERNLIIFMLFIFWCTAAAAGLGDCETSSSSFQTENGIK
jgi:hypothetical protein